MFFVIKAFRFVPLALLAFMLYACSDDSTSPDAKTDGDDFAIVSIDQDTVYWGDTVTATLKNAANDSLTVFVHSVMSEVDSIWRESSGKVIVRFILSDQTSSGQIRIYDQNGVQAKGDRVLTVIKQNRRKLHPMAFNFWPSEAYTGDLLWIRGLDFPLRAKDVSVTIDGVVLPWVSHDTSNIFVRVAPGIESGSVAVRLFDAISEVGIFRRIQPGGKLLQEGISQIRISGRGINSIVDSRSMMGGDTLFESRTGTMYDLTRRIESSTHYISGDSIFLIGIGYNAIGETTDTLEIRLKQQPDNRASGIVRLHGSNENYSYLQEIRIQDVRWQKGTTYIFRTFGPDLPSQFIDVRGEGITTYISGIEVNTINYVGPDALAIFEIECAM